MNTTVLCVLIADANSTARGWVTEMLDGPAIIKVEVNDSTGVVAAARSILFDVVVIDVRLADGGGTDLLRELRRLLPLAKIIVFTSFPYAELVERCRAAGADHVLSKSAEYEGLAGLLKSYCAAAGARS